MPVLQAMCRWGALHPGHDPTRFISASALMISMTAMIGPAGGQKITAGFRIGPEGFVQRLTGDGILHVATGSDPAVDFVMEGSGNALARAVYGPQPLAELSDIALWGDARLAQRFVDLFRLR